MSITDERWNMLENLNATIEDQFFRQRVGLDADSDLIQSTSQAIGILAEAMAPDYLDNPAAYDLLCDAIITARSTPIMLELRELREKHFTFDDLRVDGQAVTPYQVQRYLYTRDDPRERHEFLSRWVKGNAAFDEVEAQHRTLQGVLASEVKRSPLDKFLNVEGLTVERLRALLFEMGDAMRPAFEVRFADNRAACLGAHQGEAWEDFLTLFLNRWTLDIDQQDIRIDAVAAVQNTARKMGFALDKIQMDLENRPKKAPVPSAWFIRIPGDVRITIKSTDAVGNAGALYHEMGHALHFSQVSPDLPYYMRAGISDGVAETFSFWLESLLGDRLYLQRELQLNERATDLLVHFKRLQAAEYSTWLPAQALCIVDYWTDGPFSLLTLGERLAGYMQRFMGFTMPPEAIRVMSGFVRNLNFNVLGYPVAYARLGNLLTQLETAEREWWNSPEAASIVKAHMRGGRDAAFPPSMFAIEPLIQRYG